VWQSGVINTMLGIPKPGTADARSKSSTTASSTAGNGVGGSTSSTGPVTTTGGELSDADSYQAIVDEWSSIGTMRADYGEPTPGAASGVGSGWLYDTWAKTITSTKTSTSERQGLSDAATSWVDKFTTARDKFAALSISSTYQSDQQSIVAIYDLMIARADVYSRAADYAVDHPTVGKNQPWRAIQRGQAGGTSSTAAWAALKAKLDAYTPPAAP
jgi:hypothetical protein